MRDNSPIDPAGTQQTSQVPYWSGETQPQAPSGQPRPQAPQTAEPTAATEPVRAGGTDIPTTQSATEQAQTQARPSTTQEQGTAGDQRIAGEQGITREQGIWDAAKADEFRNRWHEVQTHFVEDPRGSVTEARQLVDEAVQSLADNVHQREEQLEHAGARSSDSTEGMRDTVLQYHQLLDRLLAV
ncbi:hypothetical protein AB0K00_53010 [Dactylosporangium sp. NPDC049525]|uniref:hypothetical protein n=1 Tax=Dactylosporangium sp. NPDC049525 TaxID=3154730 RepID=UPI00341E4C40